MKKALWFIKQSIVLDLKFFRVSGWSILKKIDFLVLKYYLIIWHFFKKFNLGKDFCYFDRKKIYYDSKHGLTGYQSLLARHQKLIKLEDIKGVKVVIDIGANVGFFSKLCRDIYPKSKIFAFEPIPKTFECLKKNFCEDNNMQVYNLAISDYDGRAKMNFDEQDSVISQITEKGDIEVEARVLDGFVEKNNIDYIDILKIDTEEHEAHVLRGASATLPRTRYLFIEIQIENNENYTISSLLRLLSTDNYDFQLVGFRNYSDTSEGRMRVMDALFKNIKIK